MEIRNNTTQSFGMNIAPSVKDCIFANARKYPGTVLKQVRAKFREVERWNFPDTTLIIRKNSDNFDSIAVSYTFAGRNFITEVRNKKTPVIAKDFLTLKMQDIHKAISGIFDRNSRRLIITKDNKTGNIIVNTTGRKYSV